MEFPSRDGEGGGKEGISNLSMFTYKRKHRMLLQAPYFINCAVCNDSYEKVLEISRKTMVFRIRIGLGGFSWVHTSGSDTDMESATGTGWKANWPSKRQKVNIPCFLRAECLF